MKTSKHKFTSQIEADIRLLAKTLPVMAKFKNDGSPDYRPRQVDYDYLIKYNVKLAGGVAPVRGGAYQVMELQYVNHNDIMVKIFREDGMDGVNEYCDEVRARHQERLAEVVKAHKFNKRLDVRFFRFVKKVWNFIKPIRKPKNQPEEEPLGI
jgi:hypothetical protein